MTYGEKLKDPRWQKKRLEIFQRDKFTCCDCGSTEKTLHVHHCHYERGSPWDTENEFLLTLCSECHEIRQALEDRCRFAMGKIFARLKGFYEGMDIGSGEVEWLIAFVESMENSANAPWEQPIVSDDFSLGLLKQLSIGVLGTDSPDCSEVMALVKKDLRPSSLVPSPQKVCSPQSAPFPLLGADKSNVILPTPALSGGD